MAETDGIDEALEGTLRVALTAAARTAEQIARQRELALRQAEADSSRAGREYRARLDAERAAATATLLDVRQADWWDTASVDAIARSYQTAHTWSRVDADAAAAEQLILEQARQRHGVDPVARWSLPPEPRKLDHAIGWAREHAPEHLEALKRDNQWDHTAQEWRDAEKSLIAAWEGANSADEAEKRKQAPVDETIAAAAAADRADQAVAYDSLERRQELAEQLVDVADPMTIDARVRADTSQSKPATEAARFSHGQLPRARRSRAAGSRQRQQDLSR